MSGCSRNFEPIKVTLKLHPSCHYREYCENGRTIDEWRWHRGDRGGIMISSRQQVEFYVTNMEDVPKHYREHEVLEISVKGSFNESAFDCFGLQEQLDKIDRQADKAKRRAKQYHNMSMYVGGCDPYDIHSSATSGCGYYGTIPRCNEYRGMSEYCHKWRDYFKTKNEK